MGYARGGTCGKRAKAKSFRSTLPLLPTETVTTNAYSCQIDRTEGSNRGDPEAEVVMGEFGHAAQVAS